MNQIDFKFAIQNFIIIIQNDSQSIIKQILLLPKTHLHTHTRKTTLFQFLSITLYNNSELHTTQHFKHFNAHHPPTVADLLIGTGRFRLRAPTVLKK